MRPYIKNWSSVASFSLSHLKRQIVAFGREDNKQLLADLLEMNPPSGEILARETTDVPICTLDVQVGDVELSLFSATTHFGAPLDFGISEIVIETYFPANEVTKQFFSRFEGS